MIVLKIAGWVLLGLIGLAILYSVFTLIVGLFARDEESTYDHKFFRFMIDSWTVLLLFFGRVRIHVTGLENVPKEGRFVVVGNHRSNFDPIVTWSLITNQKMAYISKPGNFKIPAFGRIIRECCFLAIDRENPLNAVKTINKAAELIKNDVVSFGLYPEGTRNKTSDPLLPFHAAIFKVPQRAQVPIVVLSLRGTDKIHKNFPLRRTHVYADFLHTISVEEMNALKSTNAISEAVQQELLEIVNVPYGKQANINSVAE